MLTAAGLVLSRRIGQAPRTVVMRVTQRFGGPERAQANHGGRY